MLNAEYTFCYRTVFRPLLKRSQLSHNIITELKLSKDSLRENVRLICGNSTVSLSQTDTYTNTKLYYTGYDNKSIQIKKKRRLSCVNIGISKYTDTAYDIQEGSGLNKFQ